MDWMSQRKTNRQNKEVRLLFNCFLVAAHLSLFHNTIHIAESEKTCNNDKPKADRPRDKGEIQSSLWHALPHSSILVLNGLLMFHFVISGTSKPSGSCKRKAEKPGKGSLDEAKKESSKRGGASSLQFPIVFSMRYISHHFITSLIS